MEEVVCPVAWDFHRRGGVASPCKEDCEERMLGMRLFTCTCGSCGADGFGPDAGSKAREVDNKISARG